MSKFKLEKSNQKVSKKLFELFEYIKKKSGKNNGAGYEYESGKATCEIS